MSTEKPKYLYHASPNKNIELFEPRAESVRHPDEGPVIFATETAERASVFIVESSDSWSQKSGFSDQNGNRIQTVIYANKERFFKKDTGGAIYTLPSDTFEINPIFTKSSSEWTSKVQVRPIKKEVYESGFKAMLELGVQVFFVTPEQLKQIQTAEDHGLALLKSLTSENSKLNINFKALGYTN